MIGGEAIGIGFGASSPASNISSHTSKLPWLPVAPGAVSARSSRGGVLAKSAFHAALNQRSSRSIVVAPIKSSESFLSQSRSLNCNCEHPGNSVVNAKDL